MSLTLYRKKVLKCPNCRVFRNKTWTNATENLPHYCLYKFKRKLSLKNCVTTDSKKGVKKGLKLFLRTKLYKHGVKLLIQDAQNYNPMESCCHIVKSTKSRDMVSERI